MSDHYPVELLLRSSHQTSEETSTSSHQTSDSEKTSTDLRVGAFNVRVFGRNKAADVDVLNILVKVCRQCFTCITSVSGGHVL